MTDRWTTPWYPGEVKPVRVGVYEMLFAEPNIATFSWWDGKQWCCIDDTPAEAAQWVARSEYQNLPWRGLKEPK